MRWVISDDGTMGEDEAFVLICSGIFAFIYWFLVYRALGGATRLYRNRRQRTLFGCVPPLLFVLLACTLLRFADPVVRGSIAYLLLFSFTGMTWLGGALLMLPFVGMNLRDDVIEKDNAAAAVTISGALGGVTLLYAGANVGTGPTIWTTIGPAALASAFFGMAWLLLEVVSRCSEAITVDRDLAAGLRLAGFLVAAGAVLGRAAAGDWVSAADTFQSIGRGGAAVVGLALLAAGLHRWLRPTPELPEPSPLSRGAIIASTYLLAAGAWVWVSLPIR